ncbi:hypothetical protein C3B64_19865 [Clostridium botulinum]|uniref:Cytosine-specific methyltransferase n=1 Tax=Clostridium botulinum TaxID=1491 RepID=A0AAU8Z5M6_CLOBO|nr:hypothetical protein C3B64_19865 [Clostridium botulinum]
MVLELKIDKYKQSSNGKELLWNDIKVISKNFENQMNGMLRKTTGSYYTSLEFTQIMIQDIINQFSEEERNNLCKKTLLEPCVGTGNFIFAYLREVSKLGYSSMQYQELIENIYVCDINKEALDIYTKILNVFVKIYFNIDLSKQYFQEHIGKGVLFNVNEDSPKYISLSDVFSEKVVKEGFDIVVTNPPYKNLKAEKSQYSNIDDYNKDKELYAKISKITKKVFTYSAYGVLNLYKLFVEEIIEKYAKLDGIVSLLIPSSILSDKTCEKLRTNLLDNHKIVSIKVMSEENNYIDAKQSLCSILIRKNSKTDIIQITKDFCENPTQITNVSLEDIINENTGNSIFALNDEEYNILKQLRKFPIVKDFDFIINMRGELDLTVNKNWISQDEGKYKLIRGKNISYYKLNYEGVEEFVSKEFVNKSNKKEYIYGDRISCQQVVNMRKERRITFAFVEPNYVLGNSCNFIAVKENDFDIDLYFLLGLFNSSIINWYFKLTSSNNHVNNYEIACFPIPINTKYKNEIRTLTKKYIEDKDEQILDEIEKLVHLAYNINSNEECISDVKATKDIYQQYFNDIRKIVPSITYDIAVNIMNGNATLETIILQQEKEFDKFDCKVYKGITDKYMKLEKGEILNHSTFKLSDLDMEMIRTIPQGGNWKNIPQETVKKSKRLSKITQTGGRTTLYGRIDYRKPSYTITTYFNRPGNGTYIHPVHDRVLSVREAARFQCFKDSYLFYGNKSQILKQVGNAVPTLLAYQIAKNIIEKSKCRTSIDLFCGAGGLTAGFKEAGIYSVLCNDIEESACVTLKINNPEIEVFCGDITLKKTKDHIIDRALEMNVDIICGGPPCQGFSMAGFRLIDDPRNQLFNEFVEIVSQVKPKVIVFENVAGLLNFQGGAVYKNILQLFSELGYYTEGRLLMASDYAVPQKRKRVIIICTRKDISILPESLFPNKITEDTENQVTAFDTIYDLEKINCSKNALYDNTKESNFVKMLKEKISYEQYIRLFETKNLNDSRTTRVKYEQMKLVL